MVHVARKKAKEVTNMMSKVLTLEEIEQTIIEAGGKCLNPYCPELYPRGSVMSYDHDGGYSIVGKEKKQWVYLSCFKCKFDYSLGKVLAEIKRDVNRETEEEKTVEIPSHCRECSRELAAPGSFPTGSYCSMYCCGCCPDRRVSPCQNEKKTGGVKGSLTQKLDVEITKARQRKDWKISRGEI